MVTGGVAELSRGAVSLRSLAIAGVCIAVIAPGCSKTIVAPSAAVTPSGFLGTDVARLTPGNTKAGQADYRYFNPAAQWTRYNKIIIDPVTFWGDDGTSVSPSDQLALTSYFQSALQNQFAKKFPTVLVPGPGVMKLQVAITDATAATPGLRTVSMVVPQLHVLEMVGSLATGRYIFAGSAQVAAKLTDASTHQVLAETVFKGLGGGSIATAAQLEWGDAENAMNLFATQAAKDVAALTSGAATPDQLPVKN